MTVDLLVISDIHGNMRATNGIRASVHRHEPDLAIICGDITNFGSREFAVRFLDTISIPILGITGNCDPPGVEDAYKEVGADYIHLEREERQGVTFLGLSGSNYSDKEIDEFSVLAQDADVWVLHSPVLDHLDSASRGKNIGEEALLPILKESRPRLVLSGHVHEDRGVIEEETTFVNPGPAYDDNYAIVKIGEEIEARLV